MTTAFRSWLTKWCAGWLTLLALGGCASREASPTYYVLTPAETAASASGNHRGARIFIRRVTLDIESAVRTVLTGRATAINVGEVNDRVFLNNSSIGRYPLLMRQRNEASHRFGRSRIVAFLSVGVALLRRGRIMTVRMQADDGAERVCRSEFIFVCNNHDQLELYGIRGHECLEANALAVLVSDPLSRMQLIKLGLQALLRRLDHAKGYEAFCARVVRIESRRRHVDILVDGESKIMSAPLHYRVRPGALRVIVPAEGRH